MPKDKAHAIINTRIPYHAMYLPVSSIPLFYPRELLALDDFNDLFAQLFPLLPFAFAAYFIFRPPISGARSIRYLHKKFFVTYFADSPFRPLHLRNTHDRLPPVLFFQDRQLSLRNPD